MISVQLTTSEWCALVRIASDSVGGTAAERIILERLGRVGRGGRLTEDGRNLIRRLADAVER